MTPSEGFSKPSVELGLCWSGIVGIAVSLAVAPERTLASIALDRNELVELDSSSLEFEQDTVEVRHISGLSHVDHHLDWIRKSRLALSQRTSMPGERALPPST
ncbi:hypothetical protein [Streptomyces sp. NPDC001292]|uniref:hypothetical protein n=1 Tax=Streptomyces sp. NPDC001292 TaxID=3364558 RepID=UPI003685CFA7